MENWNPRNLCICHGRKSNLVEFQILPVESPIGVRLNEETVLQALHAETNNWAVNVTKNAGS